MASPPGSGDDVAGTWRWNELAQRWALLAPRRAQRSHDHVEPAQPCPFCPGAEDLTPPEITRFGNPWQVRVFPNRYAALRPMPVAWSDGMVQNPAVERQTKLGGRVEPGFGHSEVVVLSPDHTADWSRLSDAAVCRAVEMLADRIVDLSSRPHIRSVLAFVNHGRAAGASRDHPHAQVMAMPIVPPEIALEARSTGRTGCVLCSLVSLGTAVSEESQPSAVAGDLSVLARETVAAVCPVWAEWSDEVLVLPRRHHALPSPAGEPRDHETVHAAGMVVRDVLAALIRLRGPQTAYNVIWHVGPDDGRTDFHWHLHLRPRSAVHAGFEQGTGLQIASVDPTDTARHLRDLLRGGV